MKVFVHCCCGPCSAGAMPQFLAAGYEPFGWFYNPNIHPFQEHKARKNSFIDYMQQMNLPYDVQGDYPLEDWLKAVAAEPSQRCVYCYSSRLSAAAQEAAKRGFPAYSTTLLISPYQNHELLKQLGEKFGEQYGVAFAYLDLRPGFRPGQDDARQRGLYMQKYCGCIYSEKERYVKVKSNEKKK